LSLAQDLTQPAVNKGGWEHLKGWRENSEITLSNGTGQEGVPFGPDYESPELWKPIWPQAHHLPVKQAEAKHYQIMFAAWQLSNAENTVGGAQ
jgi:hypothetical protein